MLKKIFVALAALLIGIYLGFVIVDNTLKHKTGEPFILNPIAKEKKQVIGFLPYWLISKAER